MLPTTSSSTSLSASSCIVQRACPSGGSEQASIASFAWPSPSNRGFFLLACSFLSSAASRPSSTNFLRARSTVAVPAPRMSAMSASPRPPPSRLASARSRMCARRRRVTDPFPPSTIPCRSDRSPSSSRT